MIEIDLTLYHKAYLKAVTKMQEWSDQNQGNEKYLRKQLWNDYKKMNLDPDGKALIDMEGVLCSADALLSIYRICLLLFSLLTVDDSNDGLCE